ncbi:MAG: 50S ribosomal protein L17 [Planctomycetes bacterium]|nr:50S ribosomal protein L17 [Planctomycetota bacterium]
MIKNLVRNLFEHGRIVTTKEKAKEARPFAERMITLAKKKDLHHYRLVADRLRLSQKFRPAPPPEPEKKEEEEEDQKKAKEKEPKEPAPEAPKRRWDIRLLDKLFNEIAPRFQDRPGGYTRIVTLSTYRRGDGANRVLFELTVGAPTEDKKSRRARAREEKEKEKGKGGGRSEE